MKYLENVFKRSKLVFKIYDLRFSKKIIPMTIMKNILNFLKKIYFSIIERERERESWAADRRYNLNFESRLETRG